MKICMCLFIWFNSILSYGSETLELVKNRKSEYRIIIGSSASRWDSLGAKTLQDYIHQISGTEISITTDSSPDHKYEICVGKNNRSLKLSSSKIKEDGFVIRTEGSKLYLIGGERKGTLNAVYTFLENYLGCRMYSTGVKVIPSNASIILPQIDVLENPAFSYRSINYYAAMHNDEYCHWHKLVDSDDKKIWGLFVHTFQLLLPEEKYFKDHPEYFAMRNGIRVPDEPCLSNTEVLRIMTDDLRMRIKQNPAAKIWSVSQNDNFSCCECPECAAIDKYEESNAGSVVHFVNKVAKMFPDKIISTLAYQYSRKAPKHVRPEKNVNIMLCTIESYRTKPLAEDTSSSGFVMDLADWAKLTDNIILWDYVVQFSNYISPFPNLHVLQPNLQLFKNYNIPMMFQQGAGSNATEFGELKTYLIAKLLWNPDINVDSLVNDFLAGYYGAADKHIRTYIDMLKAELIKSDAKLWIYSNPVAEMNEFLTPALMDKYNQIFDEAEKAVSEQPEYLERVKVARLPIIFAMLEQAKEIREGNRGILLRESDDEYKVNPLISFMLDEFLNVTNKIDNVLVNEKTLTPGQYVNRYRTMLSKTMNNKLGLFKSVQYITQPNWKYPANGEKSLTDGIHGDEDHLFNWVGYEGNDMEVIIDMEKQQYVKKVSADFLQNTFSWIFLPDEMEVWASKDGLNFEKCKTIANTTPPVKEELASPIFAFIKNFSCEFDPVEARYIKVKANSMEVCPRWHPGYPFKAWIFTDEIVVE